MHKRLAFIDTLRGVAVLSVVLQHSLEQIVESGHTGPYYWWFHDAIGYYFNFGRFGVVLFFFVSGFVIPYSFPNSATPIRDFTISRFFRLYPAYWFSILVALIAESLIGEKSFTLPQVVVNLTMFQTFVNVPNVMVIYWSLAIELIFYIGCIGLFAMGLLKRPSTAFYIVVATSLICILGPLVISQRIVWRLMEVALNLTAMFIGKVMRDASIGGRLKWWHVTICVALYCVFAMTISLRLYGGVDYRENFFFGYSIGAAYVCAAVIFVTFAAFGERLAWPFLAFVGVISYSIYLMAPFVIVLIYRTFGAGQAPGEWALFVGGIFVMAILVSWLTHVVLEKPFISFGHRFRSRSRPAVALQSSLREQGAE